jgi:hypothetical protein
VSLSGRCYYCGSSQDQTKAIVIALVSAAVAMTVLSIGVAFLPAKVLARTITTFLIVQQFALAGTDGSKDAPESIRMQMSTFFSWSV